MVDEDVLDYSSPHDSPAATGATCRSRDTGGTAAVGYAEKHCAQAC